MPLPILWKLKLKPLKKAMLTIVFIMGYSVVFVTIGRLATIFVLGKSLDTDTFWAFTIMANWYLCEMFVAHISISLPAIFHLVIRVTKHGFSSLFTDREFSNSLPRYGTSITKSRSYDRAGFARLAPEQTWPRTKVILRLDELANENKSLP
ncbi:MAG: hypothetical protein M1820_009279 [Bogoriella megaspora]|nr:MAG: hypothetical protein M1820_009279 [Bogoriella megaspora]